jgi:hypothetical protein
MPKSPKLSPKRGSANAADIYALVGASLSWWEASEDMLIGLFKTICSDKEPLAFETYVKSPRNRRSEMLKSAMKRYERRFQNDEIKQVRVAVKELDNLASVRNEIAHGHCCEYESTEDGKVVMSGNYLMPSINEGVWHERSPRYVHTVESMALFTKTVRQCRSTIMDVHIAMRLRDQKEQA